MTPQAQTADRREQLLAHPEEGRSEILKVLSLTSRETQVLILLAHGLSNKEVAFRMGISPKTSDTHRSRLYLKLGIHSVVEAVLFAVRERLVGCENKGIYIDNSRD